VGQFVCGGISGANRLAKVVRDDLINVRVARTDDFDGWFRIVEAVAGEGKWIGAELPLDRNERRQRFDSQLASDDATIFLAVRGEQILGGLGVEMHRGIAELGMMLAPPWRGLGIGSLLMEACIGWASQHGAHKVTLTVWPHNQAALALYRKFGFAEEALLRRHYRRRNGELWDAIGMGLVLDHESDGCPYPPE
jgi:RimJ/RimL family protein N-acetyltransferase